MSKTGIQLKKLHDGGKSQMKRVFTTNWYLQKVYFSPIAMRQEVKHNKKSNK